MNIFKAIKLYNKFNKAWKASKKLLDSKQGLAKETQDAIIELRAATQKFVKLYPDYQDVYLDLEVIIKDAFKGSSNLHN